METWASNRCFFFSFSSLKYTLLITNIFVYCRHLLRENRDTRVKIAWKRESREAIRTQTRAILVGGEDSNQPCDGCSGRLGKTDSSKKAQNPACDRFKKGLEVHVQGYHLYVNLLVTELEGRTASKGPRFFHFNFWPKCEAREPWIKEEKQVVEIYSTDRENEVRKMFNTSLGNWIELKSTPRSLEVRALEYGLLNQPIKAI